MDHPSQTSPSAGPPVPIRVMLIDDHATLRHGVRKLLEAYAPRYDVVAEAKDADQALSRFEAARPDVVLMDLNMRPVGGIQLMDMLHRRFPDQDPQFVVFTAEGDKQRARASFGAGARGFVSKDSEMGELAEAIDNVVAGRVHCAAEFHPGLWSRSRGPTPTHRQLQVLEHMAVNSQSRYIAEQMKITAATVDRFRTQIIRKFDLEPGELVAFAVERRWEL